jgi:hypothetical protein
MGLSFKVSKLIKPLFKFTRQNKSIRACSIDNQLHAYNRYFITSLLGAVLIFMSLICMLSRAHLS